MTRYAKGRPAITTARRLPRLSVLMRGRSVSAHTLAPRVYRRSLANLNGGQKRPRAGGPGLLEDLVEQPLDGRILHVVLLVHDREHYAAFGCGDIRVVDCQLG